MNKKNKKKSTEMLIKSFRLDGIKYIKNAKALTQDELKGRRQNEL